MKIKIVLFCSALMLITGFCFGQNLDEQMNIEKRYTGKGRFLFGTSALLLWPHGQLSTFQIGVQPHFGFFPAKNFALIGLLYTSFGASTDPKNFVINFGGGPELRYYIGNGSFKFYIYGNAVPHYSYYNQPSFGIMTGGGPGFALFTGPTFSLNFALYGGLYRTTTVDVTQPLLSFSFVFNGFFSKKNQNETELLIEEK